MKNKILLYVAIFLPLGTVAAIVRQHQLFEVQLVKDVFTILGKLPIHSDAILALQVALGIGMLWGPFIAALIIANYLSGQFVR